MSLAVTETSAAVTASDTATGTITDDDGALAEVTIEGRLEPMRRKAIR